MTEQKLSATWFLSFLAVSLAGHNLPSYVVMVNEFSSASHAGDCRWGGGHLQTLYPVPLHNSHLSHMPLTHTSQSPPQRSHRFLCSSIGSP